jgi:hypothetical protein
MCAFVSEIISWPCPRIGRCVTWRARGSVLVSAACMTATCTHLQMAVVGVTSARRHVPAALLAKGCLDHFHDILAPSMYALSTCQLGILTTMPCSQAPLQVSATHNHSVPASFHVTVCINRAFIFPPAPPTPGLTDLQAGSRRHGPCDGRAGP